MTTEEISHLKDCCSSTSKWKAEEDGRILVEGSFYWRSPKEAGFPGSLFAHASKLPWSFSKVFGHFYMSYGLFETLEGCPDFVEQNFYCYNNFLKTLIGGPKCVYGDYYCSSNSLYSFEGAPDQIGGRFIYDNLIIEKWDFESKFQVLLEGEKIYSDLISTIISPESIQAVINEDPIASAIRFKPFWNKLKAMEKYKGLRFPDAFQKEASLLADLNGIGL